MHAQSLPVLMDLGSWIWWVVAGGLLVVELMSGTFYLLMIALAFLAGGLSRLSGASGAMQFIIAAVVAVVALASLRRIKHRRRLSRGDLPISGAHSTSVPHPTGVPHTTGEARDPGDIDGPPEDINGSGLDIGAQVYVLHWQGRRARTRYRGAEWDVMLAHGAPEAPGWYRICRIEGITLILAP